MEQTRFDFYAHWHPRFRWPAAKGDPYIGVWVPLGFEAYCKILHPAIRESFHPGDPRHVCETPADLDHLENFTHIPWHVWGLKHHCRFDEFVGANDVFTFHSERDMPPGFVYPAVGTMDPETFQTLKDLLFKHLGEDTPLRRFRHDPRGGGSRLLRSPLRDRNHPGTLPGTHQNHPHQLVRCE